MATEPTLQDRLEAWGAEVKDTYLDGTDPLEAIQDLGGPGVERTEQALEWANAAPRDDLLFTLALCISEVVRRYGIEATNETLSSLLVQPDIAALGDVVHAGAIVEAGGVPERFVMEDMETAVRTALEGEGDDEIVVIDFNTGELI